MSSLRFPFLVVVSLLLADAAFAAPKAYATRDQLRECLALGDALQLRQAAGEAAAAEADRRFGANEAEDAALVKMKASLDRNDKNGVSAFNQAVVDHDLHIRQINDDAAAAEAARNAYAADRAAADDRCGKLTYRPVDIAAVDKERGRMSATAP